MNDLQVAADYLRRMAPTQSHENRRHFQQTASLIEGINLETHQVGLDGKSTFPGLTMINWPVKVDGRIKGYATVVFSTDDKGNVHVEANVEPLDEELPQVAGSVVPPAEGELT